LLDKGLPHGRPLLYISKIGCNNSNLSTQNTLGYVELRICKIIPMKVKQIYKLWLCSILVVLTSCTNAQEPSAAVPASIADKPSAMKKKVLIVYLSRTKNTRAIAEMIHQKMGGDLVALELENPYPQNYQAIVAQVSKENENDFLPPLKTKIDAIESYDLIFVGFPTWGMQLPPPIKSFLTAYDLKGKTVIPFNTNAGYGIGSSFETFKKLTPNSTVLPGYTIKGGIERDGVLFVMEGAKATLAQTEVNAWLKKINLTP
jgi:flavodoxin